MLKQVLYLRKVENISGLEATSIQQLNRSGELFNDEEIRSVTAYLRGLPNVKEMGLGWFMENRENEDYQIEFDHDGGEQVTLHTGLSDSIVRELVDRFKPSGFYYYGVDEQAKIERKWARIGELEKFFS